MVVRKPLFGTGIIVAREPSLLPQRGAADGMIDLPVGVIGNMNQGVIHLVGFTLEQVRPIRCCFEGMGASPEAAPAPNRSTHPRA